MNRSGLSWSDRSPSPINPKSVTAISSSAPMIQGLRRPMDRTV